MESDRVITFAELPAIRDIGLNRYLDLKEKKAIVERHFGRLYEQLDIAEFYVEYGRTSSQRYDNAKKQIQKLNEKINNLKEELADIEKSMSIK